MEILVTPPAEFGARAAQMFLEACSAFREPVVGLATGNTPVSFYASLRRAVAAGKADLRRLRPFAIDEYGGPRDHPCANRAFFRRHWAVIGGVAHVAQFNVATADPAAEAARFADRLAAAGGLDVVVLGIGLNGHLAFNEPGTAPDAIAAWVPLAESTRDSAHACWGADTPTHGITLGLGELLAARRVILLAAGASKATIVARALAGPVDSAGPASFLQRHSSTVVVLDEAAAAQLPAELTSRRS